MKAPSAVRAAYWVARRELHVLLRAPLLYVIGGLFLVVHGMTFAALVSALSDPKRPSPLAALLEAQLSGTLLTWVLELVVLVLLGMRAIADDKKTGAWELLLTAQVGEGAAVVGKWIAASLVYALLWLPTLVHLVVLAMFRADNGGWDVGSIIAGYAGAILLGAALLAWAIAASAAMSSVLGAGALAFALLLGMFLVGELPALAPGLASDHPLLHAALNAVSLRGTVASFARGELGLAPVVFVVATAVTGLSAAFALACAGRRRRAEVRTRTFATFLTASIGALALLLVVRNPARLDVSSTNRSTLDPATVDVLARVDKASITIIQPTLAAMEPLSAEVARIAGLMHEVAPGLTVQTIDPLGDATAIEAIAKDAGMTRDDLAVPGAVIVEANGRRRVLDVLALVSFDTATSAATNVFDQVTIEQGLTGAISNVTQSSHVGVCATTGHGELPLTATPEKLDWGRVADRLRADGMTIETIGLAVPVPTQCTVVVVAGPATPLTPDEALAIQAYLARGGALIVAAASRGFGGTLAATGLEAILANAGLGLPQAVILDEQLLNQRVPDAMRITTGYSAHPINRGYQNIRGTVWFLPRPVLVERSAQPLISTASSAWGELDMVTAPPTKADADLAGPLHIAAIGGGERIIALGSAESLSTDVLTKYVNASDHWLVGAVRYLARVPQPSLPPASSYVPVRLELTDGQRTMITALVVGGIPLLWLLVGGGLVFLRHRRSRT